MADLNEKGLPIADDSTKGGVITPPAYSNEKTYDTADDDLSPSWATRNGLNMESFKRRKKADETNQLNQTLKTRHLHMIAIGGSIGAGLFVGSSTLR